jgi:septum formation protein
VLASASPQRRAILERLGVSFTVKPSGVSERERGEPRAVALENALRKARAVRSTGARGPILGVDTLVTLEGQIYGKPRDEHEARATLGALGGATHTVISGLALVTGERERSAVAATNVTFRELSERQIEWYLAREEWRGRAGGYAIQGAAAAFVRSIEGDYENVVGLPIAALLDVWPELLGGGA